MCHLQGDKLNGGNDMRTMVMMGAGAMLAAVTAEAQNARVDEYVDSAREIAGAEYAGMVDRLCPAPVAASSGPGRGRMNAPRGAPDQESWYAEPVKVFENLYYVGMTEFSTWAVTTSDGIIIIDPIFDYSVEAEVVDGLRKLGFDPANIKYVIVSHGHGDHAGGAKFLQETFGASVLMGAADWDLVEQQNPSWKPERDIVVAEDRQLTLGDTTLELHLTPGHTWGTISTLIPVRDGDRQHVAALWGGTLFNFGPEPERFVAYAESAERFAQLAAAAGADVLLSNHTDYDGSKQKLPALASRGAGEPHPYVVGGDSVRRYLAVAQTCAEAALAEVE
jgi:metallo-beta-lactamase class B